ncbi:MAG: hypothetical protein FE78DRAFT_69448 [Acidomyces sp. 'richmondensis']|nr:MAG: hypothetical protein FE78DRAFT_69448 [Acidomyces sp. 'richmondensis']
MSQAEWHFSVSSEGLSVGVRRYNVVLTRPLRVQCCSRARNDSYKSICEVSLRFSARKRQQQCDRMRSCIPRPLLSGMKRRCLQSEIVDRSALGSSHFSADSRVTTGSTESASFTPSTCYGQPRTRRGARQREDASNNICELGTYKDDGVPSPQERCSVMDMLLVVRTGGHLTMLRSLGELLSCHARPDIIIVGTKGSRSGGSRK